MPNDPSAKLALKNREELRALGQSDLEGLIDYTFELQAEVARWRESAAQDSHNSSRPPSSDRGSAKPKPKSLRKKSGRPSGGQPGHPGRTLQFSDTPKHVQVHPLLECECGEDLSRQPAVDFQRRQVFDLPSLELECTEHRAEVKDCHCGRTCTAAFPADLKAPVQYGKNFRALLSYLYDAQEGASLRIREMGQEMFGYAVSEATVQSARQEQFNALQPFEKRLEEILPKEPVLHADETSLPVNKLTYWLHVLCTPLLTFFSVQAHRGKEGILAVGIIPRFTGWLMHDFLSSYLSFDNCLHTFCKSHLLRELVFLFEEHEQKWAQELYDLFLEMLRAAKDRKDRGVAFSAKELDQWEDRYWQTLRAGRAGNPITPEQRAQKRRKQSKAQNLLDRLEHYDSCILAFLAELDVPFTNNEAERPLRMMKVRVKISGCFRTLEGARRHARIRSYISTLRKHGLPVLEYLRAALEGRPFLPEGSDSS